ncbi:membrane protein required for colicin V production [Monaibacterium marinum]|uniref:Membrane protein required for colicin V production n=1 Tax=Pontivivens marinum TaxID=1690039 RepID=A0A2C9CSF5_9RHOB|nr:CvpA family protein [Monaibacterium marinum]SOH94451.1 membrane protein required for colicin V production [Monaibacterium marinum]
MDQFTLVDAGVAGIVLISGLLAYSRGFVREVLSIAGWVLAAVAAFFLAPKVEPIISELPVVSDIIGGSCQISIIAAAGIVFVITLIIISLFSPLISSSVQNSALSPIDSGLGLLFGIARGLLLVAIAFVIYDQTPVSDSTISMVENAATRDLLETLRLRVTDLLPTEIPPQIVESYDHLMGRCSG